MIKSHISRAAITMSAERTFDKSVGEAALEYLLPAILHFIHKTDKKKDDISLEDLAKSLKVEVSEKEKSVTKSVNKPTLNGVLAKSSGGRSKSKGSSDKRCTYIYQKGDHKGEQCKNDSAEGQERCKQCLRKGPKGGKPAQKKKQKEPESEVDDDDIQTKRIPGENKYLITEKPLANFVILNPSENEGCDEEVPQIVGFYEDNKIRKLTESEANKAKAHKWVIRPDVVDTSQGSTTSKKGKNDSDKGSDKDDSGAEKDSDASGADSDSAAKSKKKAPRGKPAAKKVENKTGKKKAGKASKQKDKSDSDDSDAKSDSGCD